MLGMTPKLYRASQAASSKLSKAAESLRDNPRQDSAAPIPKNSSMPLRWREAVAPALVRGVSPLRGGRQGRPLRGGPFRPVLDGLPFERRWRCAPTLREPKGPERRPLASGEQRRTTLLRKDWLAMIQSDLKTVSRTNHGNKTGNRRT